MIWTLRKKEYILCAAIWVKDGKHYEHQPKNIEWGIVICGRRHHNCFTVLARLGIDYKGVTEQGFITSKDIFVNRYKAGRIVFKCGQTKELSDHLISEEIY